MNVQSVFLKVLSLERKVYIIMTQVTTEEEVDDRILAHLLGKINMVKGNLTIVKILLNE